MDGIHAGRDSDRGFVLEQKVELNHRTSNWIIILENPAFNEVIFIF